MTTVIRSSAVVGVGTLLSRVTGVMRVGALTYALGATATADAYNLANNTPNIIYELLLGGVLSATLVPIFVEHSERDDRDATSAVVSVAVAALAALTVLAVLAAPFIFKLYTWRLSGDEAAAQETVAVPLLRLFLPQMLFYGLTALGVALCHARRRFAMASFAPVLNNVVVSGVLVAFARVSSRQPSLGEVHDNTARLWLLGLGTTAGIVAMTVALWPAVRAAGWRLRWNFNWRHPAVRQVARLSGWTFGYVAANQVAFFVILALANRQPGWVSAYTYAFVFFQLPHGLFSVSIMTAYVPELAGAATRGAWRRYRRQFSQGLKYMALVVLPASVGYVLLARPLVATLLERGAFTDAGPTLTADTLVMFAVGLLGFSAYLYALRGFYALRDTRTPFLLNVMENGINVAAALLLERRYGVQGLAFSYSLAYTVSAVVALAMLRRRVGAADRTGLVLSLVRITIATAVMGGAVWALTRVLGSESGTGALVQVATVVPIGAMVYVLAALALGVDELGGVRDRVLGFLRPLRK